MDCKEAEDLLGAYALNALSPEEEARMREHVDLCSWCGPLLREHLQVAAFLAQAVEGEQPPASLKGRTMRAVERHPSPRWIPRRHRVVFGRLALAGVGLVATALLSVILGVGMHMSRQIDDLRSENSEQAAQVGQLQAMALEQRSIDYVTASFGEKQVLVLRGMGPVPKAQGMLLIAENGGTGILMARGLKPPSANMAYQVWFTDQGQTVAAGRLSVDEHGWGILYLWPGPDKPLTRFQEVGVTAEGPQDGGVTRTPVLLGEMAAR